MRVEISEQPLSALGEYANVPISFDVSVVLDVAEQGKGSSEFVLTERSLNLPYLKDYDSIDGKQPHLWAKRFDLSNWGVFMAHLKGRGVGGAVVAFNTPGVLMLEGRDDLAVLWDIRVSPDARGQGVGSALFRAAERWAIARGCQHLKVETQNINVSACRFYARQGCVLTAIDRSAYPELPDEIQLLWYKALADGVLSG
jgi:GNAT superfamily N-acetyltransferase